MNEAALLTPYSAEYLSLLARRGKLSAKKINNAWYTTKPVVLDYMKRQVIRNRVRSMSIGENLSFAGDKFVPEESHTEPQIAPQSREPEIPKTLERVEWTPAYKLPKQRSYQPLIALAIAVTCVYSLGNLLTKVDLNNKNVAAVHSAFLSAVDQIFKLDTKQGSFVDARAVTGTALTANKASVSAEVAEAPSGVSQPQTIFLPASNDALRSELLGLVGANYAQVSSSLSAILDKRLDDFRREELSREIHTVVTSQSSSDVSGVLNQTISAVLTSGIFSNSKISSAVISGSTFSGSLVNATGLSFTNATGTSATTTNLFSTQGSFTNLGASSGSITNLLINGSTTIQNLTFGSATGTSATTTNLYTGGQTILAGVGGNVGIGTTNPVYGKLSVVDSENTALTTSIMGDSAPTGGVMDAVYNNSQTVGSFSGIRFITRNSGAKTWGIYNVSTGASTGDFVIGGGSGAVGSEAMRITNIGNVGIGTTTPIARTEIVNSSGETLRLDKGTGASLQFARNSVAGYQIDDNSGDMRWLSGGTSVKMQLTSGGNLGIGLTNPTDPLYVHLGTNRNFRIKTDVGCENTTGVCVQSINDANSANAPLSIAGSLIALMEGNVGIGTTNPGSPLEVIGAGAGFTSVGYFKDLATNGNPLIQIGDAAHAISIGHVNTNPSAANYGFIAYTGLDPTTGQGIILKSNGLVGIGTTNPAYSLDILNTAPTSNGNWARFGAVYAAGENQGAYPSVGYNIKGTGSTGFNYAASDFASWIKFNSGRVETYTAVSGTGGAAISPTTGPFVAQGSNTWTNGSDIRLKTNVTDYSVLERIGNFRAVSFDWRNPNAAHPHDFGVIAQELYQVFPEAVDVGQGDPNAPLGNGVTAWGVEYDKLSAVALEGVKELNQKFDLNASTTAAAIALINSQLQNSSTTAQSILSSVLSNFKADIVNGVTHFIALAVDNLSAKKLAVGESSNPSGITLYDEDTGAPYCFKIKSGAPAYTQGECGTAPTPIYNPPIMISTTTPPSDAPSSDTNGSSSPDQTIEVVPSTPDTPSAAPDAPSESTSTDQTAINSTP